jgi:hypothetical protein
MQMHMPDMAGAGHHAGGPHGHHGSHGHHGHHGRGKMPMMMFVMFHSLFAIAATVCFLGALNRAANALKLESRVSALTSMPDAFSEDEQLVLIEKITTRALGPF